MFIFISFVKFRVRGVLVGLFLIVIVIIITIRIIDSQEFFIELLYHLLIILLKERGKFRSLFGEREEKININSLFIFIHVLKYYY